MVRRQPVPLMIALKMSRSCCNEEILSDPNAHVEALPVQGLPIRILSYLIASSPMHASVQASAPLRGSTRYPLRRRCGRFGVIHKVNGGKEREGAVEETTDRRGSGEGKAPRQSSSVFADQISSEGVELIGVGLHCNMYLTLLSRAGQVVRVGKATDSVPPYGLGGGVCERGECPQGGRNLPGEHQVQHSISKTKGD